MLEQLKQEVLRCACQAENSGLCRHKAGNFSARDPQSGYICLTPSGLDRAELTPEDICIVDAELNPIEVQPDVRPTSEARLHTAIYAQYPNIGAVVHTHSKYATTFAVLNRAIPAVVYEIMMLGCRRGCIPVVPYARPGTPQLAQSALPYIQDSDVVLLQSHGVLAVADSLKEALLKAQYAEELAEIYYHALLVNGGKEPPTVPLQEINKWEYLIKTPPTGDK